MSRPPFPPSGDEGADLLGLAVLGALAVGAGYAYLRALWPALQSIFAGLLS